MVDIRIFRIYLFYKGFLLLLSAPAAGVV